MQKTKLSTTINAVISKECQSGKTTWVINKILDEQNCDHFLFTYDKTPVLQDAIHKFYSEAEKRGLRPKLITDKKDLNKVHKDRLKGLVYPVVCIFFGNINHFRATKVLLSMSKHTGIPQHFYLDEIHRYTLGEDMESDVQIDNFVNELLKNNQSDYLWCISATSHDLLHTDLEFGEESIVLEPYPGFKGLRQARWVNIEDYVFKELLASYRRYKNEGIDSDLPREIYEVIDVYAAKDMLINLNPEQKFHEWMASKIIDGGSYNGTVKSLIGNFIGKYSMSMSTTFPDHNKILYYNKMNSSAQVGAVVQELGRVNGRKTPVIITTKAVQKAVLSYLEFNDSIITKEVYKLPARQRQSWLNSYLHENPEHIPGRKHKKNRVITSFAINTEGSKDTCNEEFKQLYLPEVYNKEWKGKGIGLEIKEAIKNRDPNLYNLIKDMSYLTDTDTRDDGTIWHKNREGNAQVRFGKDWSQHGYVSIVIRKSMETGFESFYDVTGALCTNKTENMGYIMRPEAHKEMKEVEARIHAQLQLHN